MVIKVIADGYVRKWRSQVLSELSPAWINDVPDIGHDIFEAGVHQKAVVKVFRCVLKKYRMNFETRCIARIDTVAIPIDLVSSIIGAGIGTLSCCYAAWKVLGIILILIPVAQFEVVMLINIVTQDCSCTYTECPILQKETSYWSSRGNRHA